MRAGRPSYHIFIEKMIATWQLITFSPIVASTISWFMVQYTWKFKVMILKIKGLVCWTLRDAIAVTNEVNYWQMGTVCYDIPCIIFDAYISSIFRHIYTHIYLNIKLPAALSVEIITCPFCGNNHLSCICDHEVHNIIL